MYNPITGIGDGSPPVVNLTFPYIDPSHVKASVNDVSATFTWTGASQITFDAAVPAGAAWSVTRSTPMDQPLVDFTNGSVLTESDLDLNAKQSLYVSQELHGLVADLPTDPVVAGFSAGPSAPNPGVTAAVSWKREPASPTHPLTSWGNLWADETYVDTGFGAKFDASHTVTSPQVSPAVGLLTMATNEGTDAIVVPLMAIGGLYSSGDEVAAANFIAYAAPGVTNGHLGVLELDYIPDPTATIVEAYGLLINAFADAPGPALLIGGAGVGAKWATGVQVGDLQDTGAALSPGPGNPRMGSLIDTGVAQYQGGAIALSNTHPILFRAASGHNAELFVDASNFLHFIMPDQGVSFRNPTDTATLVSLDTSGNLTLSGSGTIQFPVGLSSSTATAGAQTLPANPVGFLTVTIDGTNRKVPYYAV